MDDPRGLDPYRESLEMGRAELLDALTTAGVPRGRAERLVDRLVMAASSLAETICADATDRIVEGLAVQVGRTPDELIGLADGRLGTTRHVIRPDLSVN